jgi:uncharacterized protein (DUF952 family)/heme-degrading monooxygenase HmoA
MNAGQPYTAVIFTSRHSGLDREGYAKAAERMERLAAAQPGYRGIESTRGPDGLGITVSYWDTDADAQAWKQHDEHLAIQQVGRERWYTWYRLQVATVEREYEFGSPTNRAQILHMALPADWRQAQTTNEYRVSTRGVSLEQEGFIHCSFPHQLEGVANRFYADLTDLELLHVQPDLLDVAVRVEPPADGVAELFPHVYGPIPTTAVVAVTPWRRGDDGIWHRPATV